MVEESAKTMPSGRSLRYKLPGQGRVRARGLEPPSPKGPGPKPGASASSATPAWCLDLHFCSSMAPERASSRSQSYRKPGPDRDVAVGLGDPCPCDRDCHARPD